MCEQRSRDPRSRARSRFGASPDLSEGPHLGYALQWFAFAVVAGVVYVGVVRARLRKEQAQESQPDESDTSGNSAEMLQHLRSA